MTGFQSCLHASNLIFSFHFFHEVSVVPLNIQVCLDIQVCSPRSNQREGSSKWQLPSVGNRLFCTSLRAPLQSSIHVFQHVQSPFLCHRRAHPAFALRSQWSHRRRQESSCRCFVPAWIIVWNTCVSGL